MPTSTRVQARVVSYERPLKPWIEFNFGGSGMQSALSALARTGPATMWQDDGSLGWGACNLQLYSDAQSNWTVRGTATITTGQSDPFGGTSAALFAGLNAAGANDSYRVGTSAPLAGLALTTTLWIKKVSTSGTLVVVHTTSNTNGRWYVNLALLGTGWERLTATHAAVTVDASWTAAAAGAVGTLLAASAGGPLSVYICRVQQQLGATDFGDLPATGASAVYLPRQYLHPVLGVRGLKVETAATNYFFASNLFSDAAWYKANLTLTAGATTGPDGTLSGWKFEATATAATNCYQTATTISSTSVTYSVWAKKGSGATHGQLFGIYNATTSLSYVVGTINYDTGVFTTSILRAGCSVLVESRADGWHRIKMTAVSMTAGDDVLGWIGWGGSSTPAGQYVYIYNTQLEAGEVATMDIYTPTAATASRTADAFSYTLPAALATALSTAGTVLVDFCYDGAGSAANSGNRVAMHLSNGVHTDSWFTYNGSSKQAATYLYNSVAGNGTVGIHTSGCNAHVRTKAAARVGPGTEALAVNGTLFAGSPLSPPPVDRLAIGSWVTAGVSCLQGTIFRILIWDRVLSDAELQAVTA